ncbi:DUF2637 domain-containing protein [Streptomyces sp. NPDC005336]|uniref:DUF2637 domain-containing protein n=1 Tax=Streptomyces sp. NPDC005336 TaxID=3157035 RepID=UPI0033A9F003
MAAMQLTRTHRILIGVVVAGAVVIAAIGFAGSYTAVRNLARDKGFGDFANVFPIGIDAGIVVLLALDLLLTWIRIPFPLLRQTAWLLTIATIAFNGAAAWPDPLGVGMHAVIPILFVVSVEAARHAVGRIADITADRHMESVRIARWLLAPLPTFRLWRRMKLWELRSYDEVIRLEQDRLVYRARLRARYGRAWRRRAPVESLMPLRLARYGVPLAETAPAGLAAAGLEPIAVLPAALPAGRTGERANGTAIGTATGATDGTVRGAALQGPQRAADGTPGGPAGAEAVAPAGAQQQPQELPQELPVPGYPQPAAQDHDGRAFTAFDPAAAHPVPPGPLEEPAQPQVTVPVVPGGRVRQLGGQGVGTTQGMYVPGQREPEAYAEYEEPVGPRVNQLPEDIPRDEVYYGTFRQFLADNARFPSAYQFGQRLREAYGVTDLSNNELAVHVNDFKERYRMEMEAEHIP